MKLIDRLLTYWKHKPLPRWAGWPGKGGLFVAVGIILVFTGLRPVIASYEKGISPLFGSNSAGEQEHIIATAQPAADLILPYYAQPSPTPFQPAEASRIQELLKPQAARPTPIPIFIPDSISIPAIHLSATIQPVGANIIELDGQLYQQWNAPDEFAVGWHNTSSPLGRIGNTVLNGHNNIYGEVFRNLAKIKPGDKIYLTSGDLQFTYLVTNSMKLKEEYQDVNIRMENARWIEPSMDERVTLISCWPYSNNTYRWVVVAIPTGSSERIPNIDQ